MAGAAFAETLVRQLDLIAPRSPGLALRLAALAGAALGPRLGTTWWPAAAELEALLGTLEPGALARSQRAIAAGELRNRALRAVLARHGSAPLAARIRVRGADTLRRLHTDKIPVVVLWWHQGVARAVEAALPALGLPALVATNAPRGPGAGYRWQVVVDDPGAGARFLGDALREVKRGVVPVLSLDTPPQQAPRLPFFTGSLPMATGAAWLAARAEARLIPATSRWVGLDARVEVTLHEPVGEPGRRGRTPEAWEREMLANAVRWYEDHLRRHPEELSLAQVREALRGGPDRTQPPGERDFARLLDEFDAAGA